MTHLIYIARNTVTGDEYVGATGKGLSTRKRQHLASARHAHKRPQCWRFNRAIREYGEEAFEWSIFANDLTIDEAMKLEVLVIAERKPAYNISIGGGSLVAIRHSEGAIAKIIKPVLCLTDNRMFPSVKSAAAFYGADVSQVSKAVNFKRATAGGVMFVRTDGPFEDEELRLMLIDEIMAKRDFGLARAGQANRRPVICVDTGVRYESATVAGLALGIPPNYVAQLANRGRAVKDAGPRFRYEDRTEVDRQKKPRAPRPMGIPVSTEARAKIGAKAKARGMSQATREARAATSRKMVFCPQLDTTYGSVIAAAKAAGLHKKYVGLLARTGGTAIRSGLTFKYIGEQ